MFGVFLLGGLGVVLSVFVCACFIALASRALERGERAISQVGPILRTELALTILSLWLLVGVVLGLVIWAVILLAIGEFDTFEDALYFASVSATTLGFGDELLSDRWRLLSGVLAANGLILFGLNSAFLFDALGSLRAHARRQP